MNLSLLFFIVSAICLLHVEYQALEVFAFGVVDVDWVVGWLCELMKDAH